MYAVCTDPFVSAFHARIDAQQLGVTRVCADDVGAAMTSISVLPRYTSVFDIVSATAGLHMQPPKCKLIPLWQKLTSSSAEGTKTALSIHVPGCTTFVCGPFPSTLSFFSAL